MCEGRSFGLWNQKFEAPLALTLILYYLSFKHLLYIYSVHYISEGRFYPFSNMLILFATFSYHSLNVPILHIFLKAMLLCHSNWECRQTCIFALLISVTCFSKHKTHKIPFSIYIYIYAQLFVFLSEGLYNLPILLFIPLHRNWSLTVSPQRWSFSLPTILLHIFWCQMMEIKIRNIIL